MKGNQKNQKYPSTGPPSLNRDISLEFSYIDLQTSSASSPTPSRFNNNPQAKDTIESEMKNLEVSSHLSKQESFAILNASMFRNPSSSETKPSKEKEKLASRLLRPKPKPNKKLHHSSMDYHRIERLTELFRKKVVNNKDSQLSDSRSFNGTLLCDTCINDLYSQVSAKVHHQTVQEFHQLERYYRQSQSSGSDSNHNTNNSSINSNNMTITTTSFNDLATKQLATHREVQQWKQRNREVESEIERLKEEIQLLESHHSITREVTIRSLTEEVRRYRDRVSGSVVIKTRIQSAEEELNQILRGLQMTQIESNLITSLLSTKRTNSNNNNLRTIDDLIRLLESSRGAVLPSLSPLFDEIACHFSPPPTNTNTNTNTTRSINSSDINNNHRSEERRSDSHSSSSTSLLSTAKKLFSLRGSDEEGVARGGLTGSLSRAITTTTTSEEGPVLSLLDYAVINGHRLSVSPIPLLQLNWEEINVSLSLLVVYLQAFHNLVNSSTSDSVVIKLGSAREVFPLLHSQLVSCLSEDYHSLLGEARQKLAWSTLELRLCPLLDRSLVVMRSNRNSNSNSNSDSDTNRDTNTTVEEILHLEGGVLASHHFPHISHNNTNNSNSNTNVMMTEREESVTVHHCRAIIALITIIVHQILGVAELLLSQLPPSDGEITGERTVWELLRRLLPSQSLLAIAIAILCDLSIGFESSDDDASPTVAGDYFSVAVWLRETNSGQSLSRKKQEEIERFLLLPSYHSSSQRPEDTTTLLPLLQRVLYNVLRVGGLLPLTPQTITEAELSVNHLLIQSVASLAAITRRSSSREEEDKDSSCKTIAILSDEV